VKVEWQDLDHKGIERLGEVISFIQRDLD